MYRRGGEVGSLIPQTLEEVASGITDGLKKVGCY